MIQTVQILQSHMILTMSHWSSGLPVCFPPQGTQVQIPWGDLCETGIHLLALSRYIGDPNVIRSLASSPSKCFTRLRANNVQAEIDLITQLFCPGFTLTAGLPSGFTTDEVGCWGGEPCRAPGEPAISHDSHHVSLVQWTTCLLPATRDSGSDPLGGLMRNQDFPVSVVSLQDCIFKSNSHRQES
jgi:hypothetical protein